MIEKRPFGRTGHQSTVTLFGAAALATARPLYSLGHPDDWDEAMGPGGALEAAVEAQEDNDRAVHWILGLPGVFINTAGDLALLPRILDAASRFERRPPDAEMEAMLGSTRMTSPSASPPDAERPRLGRAA